MYIRIDNVLYDITNFKHPGGNVIKTHEWKTNENIDATNAFHQFHNRSKKAFSVLKKLPTEKVDVPRDEIEREFRIIVSRLRRDGYFDPSMMHIMYRLMMNSSLWLFGLYLVANARILLGVIPMSIAYVQCGWIQHECGHNSFTCIPSVDRVLQMIYINIFLISNICR